MKLLIKILIWFLPSKHLSFYNSKIFFVNPPVDFLERIINLYHDIMFYLIILYVLVFWFLININFFFENKNIKKPSKTKHNTVLEIIWTIISCILLLIIAIPSLTLIFSFQPINKSNVVFKIIGNQWWWAYKYEMFKKNKITYSIWLENFFNGIESNIKNIKENLRQEEYPQYCTLGGHDLFYNENNNFQKMYLTKGGNTNASNTMWKKIVSGQNGIGGTIHARRKFTNPNLDTKRNFLESMLKLDPEFWRDFCKEKNVKEPITVIHESEDLLLKKAIRKKKENND